MRLRVLAHWVALATWIALLAGCTGAGSPAGGPAAPSDQPADMAPSALPEGQRYEVDPEASHLRIVLGTAGPLANLGHPHVIGGPVIAGEIIIADPWEDSAFRLQIPVESLQVDPPAWRAAEGFDPEVPESDIAATRDNMLSETQLNAAEHPMIRIDSLAIRGPQWQPDITLQMTVAGETSVHRVPVALEWDADQLTATGQLRTTFTALGLEPYSALGGALRVADEFFMRFRVRAFPE